MGWPGDSPRQTPCFFCRSSSHLGLAWLLYRLRRCRSSDPDFWNRSESSQRPFWFLRRGRCVGQGRAQCCGMPSACVNTLIHPPHRDRRPKMPTPPPLHRPKSGIVGSRPRVNPVWHEWLSPLTPLVSVEHFITAARVVDRCRHHCRIAIPGWLCLRDCQRCLDRIRCTLVALARGVPGAVCSAHDKAQPRICMTPGGAYLALATPSQEIVTAMLAGSSCPVAELGGIQPRLPHTIGAERPHEDGSSRSARTRRLFPVATRFMTLLVAASVPFGSQRIVFPCEAPCTLLGIIWTHASGCVW